MAAGNRSPEFETRVSPIVEAVAAAESGTTGEIRVHLSRRWFEKDPFGRARRMFDDFGMTGTPGRNAVLLYLNLRRRRFAVVVDEGFVRAAGPRFCEQLGTRLREDLLSTHHENAISLAVGRIGEVLRQQFSTDRVPKREAPQP